MNKLKLEIPEHLNPCGCCRIIFWLDEWLFDHVHPERCCHLTCRPQMWDEAASYGHPPASHSPVPWEGGDGYINIIKMNLYFLSVYFKSDSIELRLNEMSRQTDFVKTKFCDERENRDELCLENLYESMCVINKQLWLKY